MDKQILSIRLMNELEPIFKHYFALDNVWLISCQKADEVAALIEEERFCLIVFNALGMTSDQAQDAISPLRALTFIPLLVICETEYAAALTSLTQLQMCCFDLI